MRKLRGLLVLSLVAVSGCVKESTDGPTSVFTYELWLPLSILLGGIIAGVSGWKLRETTERWGWGLLICGPIASLFFAPTLFLTRTTVDEQGFISDGGIWGLTTHHEVALDDLKEVHITSEERTGRRGRKITDYFMVCKHQGGGSEKVPINNDVDETASIHFLKLVSNRGIPVFDDTK